MNWAEIRGGGLKGWQVGRGAGRQTVDKNPQVINLENSKSTVLHFQPIFCREVWVTADGRTANTLCSPLRVQ